MKRLRGNTVPSLRNLCLDVLLPSILLRNDRYQMMDLGPDISSVVLHGLRDHGKLTAESMKLFMHAHLTRLDLGGYENTTQQFLDTICKLSATLLSLNLKHCSKIVDFSPLSACRQLETLDLSDTKLASKHLSALNLPNLVVLKLARTKVLQLPSWLPVSLMELDLQQTAIDDHAVPYLRRLVNLRHLNVADTGIRVAYFACLKELVALNCSGCSLLQSESLYWIAGCRNLVWLDLSRSSVKGAALFQLRNLVGLTQLMLPPSLNCTPEDFRHISGLHRLESLSLARYPVQDLRFCQALAQLSFLDCSSCPLKDLDPIVGMSSLAQLNLQDCQGVTDLSLIPLARLPMLQTLNLSHTRVSDSGLKIVGECLALCSLNLSKLEVSDSGLRLLTSLTRLNTLDLRSTRIARSDITLLQNLTLLVNCKTDPPPLDPNDVGGVVAARFGGGPGNVLGGGDDEVNEQE